MSTETTATWAPRSTFASRLILVRRELDLTVKEAAERADLHYATWSTWENGKTPRKHAAAVEKIAAAFGVDRSWLMWGIPSPGSHDGHPLQPTGYTGHTLSLVA